MKASKPVVLVVVAHPDDEVLFGWPVLQCPDKWSGVYAVSLAHNRGKYGVGPMRAFDRVCKENKVHNCSLLVHQQDTGFSRLDPRPKAGISQVEALETFRRDLIDLIDKIRPDYVFTHNFVGEYGHTDHKTTLDVCLRLAQPMMMTDIWFSNPSHFNPVTPPCLYNKFMTLSDRWELSRLDLEWMNRMTAIYKAEKAWSWSREYPTECRLMYYE